MVTCDIAIASFYKLSVVTMSPSAAVWPHCWLHRCKERFYFFILATFFYVFYVFLFFSNVFFKNVHGKSCHKLRETFLEPKQQINMVIVMVVYLLSPNIPNKKYFVWYIW